MTAVIGIYITVAIIGIIIALVLAYFATTQSRGDTNTGKKPPKPILPVSANPLENTVIKEIAPLVRSRGQSEIIGKRYLISLIKNWKKG